jgi:hypothetical protein
LDSRVHVHNHGSELAWGVRSSWCVVAVAGGVCCRLQNVE